MLTPTSFAWAEAAYLGTLGACAMMIRSVFVVVTVLALVGCDSGATVTVRNESPHTLKHLVLRGSCFRTPVEDIKPHSSSSYRLRQPCESGLGLEFEAAGRRVAAAPQGYF